MKCDRRILFMLFHAVFLHLLCVSVCVCLAVTGEFPYAADPDEWVTCVRVCVCVFVCPRVYLCGHL